MLKKVVFCKDCQYVIHGFMHCSCRHPKHIEIDNNPYVRWIEYPYSMSNNYPNKANDCRDFVEIGRWRKFWVTITT